MKKIVVVPAVAMLPAVGAWPPGSSPWSPWASTASRAAARTILPGQHDRS